VVEPLDNLVRANVGIIAHGDADGICSAAIVKSLHPGASILFSKASQLHKTLKTIEKNMKTIDTLFIVDVAINPKNQEFVLDRLKKMKARYDVYYFDNHILPINIEDKNLTEYVDKYTKRTDWSSSAITFNHFFGSSEEGIKSNRILAFLAAYGAISDYARECSFLRTVFDLYDESNINYQAFMLKQACRIIQSDDIKRGIADKLSVGILPSEIAEVLEAARAASREVDMAIRFIKQHAQKYGEIGIIFECPVASMGHNSFVAATMTDSVVGVAIRRKGGDAYFVLRKRHYEDLHLGEMASSVAQKLDCDGGGEAATAGITALDIHITVVLEEINRHVLEYLESRKHIVQRA
jgi:RecJ-like exonuclease